ncbi:MAG: hypothetical protein H6Q26_1206 [Bacteroidetes bacterium]|nr:hypothetical protein [Bacteroidota bacterium]
MAINLQKGQRINIGLSKITIGPGWDARSQSTACQAMQR